MIVNIMKLAGKFVFNYVPKYSPFSRSFRPLNVSTNQFLFLRNSSKNILRYKKQIIRNC
jgi:hypothetical protein